MSSFGPLHIATLDALIGGEVKDRWDEGGILNVRTSFALTACI